MTFYGSKNGSKFACKHGGFLQSQLHFNYYVTTYRLKQLIYRIITSTVNDNNFEGENFCDLLDSFIV